jgi:peptidoglycan/LPS O-acetylase OafA/YrhL
MGLIRFLLAAAVVLGHAPGWGGFPTFSAASGGFMMPYHAVQAFFILSGFYMALIWPRYEGLTWKFYVNRYSRLIFSFWIVAGITLALWLLYPTNPMASAGLKSMAEARGWWAVVMAVPNLFLIGADSFDYFARDLPKYWLVPQTWTLGTEIWFYLLVPLLVPARAKWLIAIIAAGIVLRLVLMKLHVPFHPWQQKLFWTELSFFLIGILAHRSYVRMSASGQFALGGAKAFGWVALFAGVVFLALGNHLHLFIRPYEESLWNSVLTSIVFYLLIPWWHFMSKDWSWDRFVGEFSYPVYLWHIVIAYYSIWAQTLWYGYFLLLCSVLASVPIVILVEKPLERWRQTSLARLRGRRKQDEREVSVDSRAPTVAGSAQLSPSLT